MEEQNKEVLEGWNELKNSDFPPMVDWDITEELEGELTQIKDKVGPNESFVYEVTNSEGKQQFWGTTTLNGKLSGLELGTVVKIVYKGFKKNPKTGRNFRDFEVYTKK